MEWNSTREIAGEGHIHLRIHWEELNLDSCKRLDSAPRIELDVSVPGIASGANLGYTVGMRDCVFKAIMGK